MIHTLKVNSHTSLRVIHLMTEVTSVLTLTHKKVIKTSFSVILQKKKRHQLSPVSSMLYFLPLENFLYITLIINTSKTPPIIAL